VFGDSFLIAFAASPALVIPHVFGVAVDGTFVCLAWVQIIAF